MGISASHLKQYVITPALQKAGWWCVSAEDLVLGTAMQESGCGTFLKQNSGPALGIYQIEPATLNDLFANYLHYHPDLLAKLQNLTGIDHPDTDALVHHLRYATLICRLIYMRDPTPLPYKTDIIALSKIYKRVFNTPLGKATEDEFINNWRKYNDS